MRTKFWICIFLMGTAIASSQEKTNVPKMHQQNGFVMMDFLSVDMPSNPVIPMEPHKGLSGIHYNLSFDNFYTGVGIYGSLRGARGGFFTLGVNAGYKSQLTDKLFLDTGIHFGGGGGAAAPDGGGAFILPHVNLGYDFGKFSLTSGYSYINFFDGGNIKSHQLLVAVQIPVKFELSGFDAAESNYSLERLTASGWNKPAREFSFMFHLNNLKAQGRSTGDQGISLDGTTIRLAGFEAATYFDDHWFAFLKTDGAYDGIRAGYMDVFLGGGYRFTMNKKRTNVLAKFGVGAGGGGGVATEGGLMIYPDISLEQYLFDNIYLAANTGYVLTPNSRFSARTYGLGLKYYTHINGIQDVSATNAKFKGFEIIVKQDVYLDAERIFEPTEDLYQIALQINYFLNKTVYLAGQTAFANFGNAGAYAEGIVGLGLQSKRFANQRVNVFAQALIGGAGGGNINTGEGLIVKPSAGFNYRLSKGLSARAAAGFVRSRGGALNSTLFNLGLSYQLTFLTAK